MILNKDTDPNELIRKYGKLVSSIARRMIQDSSLAEDAAQEAWMRVIQGLPSFQGKSKISTWIYTVAARKIMDFSIKEKNYSTRFLKDIFQREERQTPYEDEIENKLWIKEKCDNCLTGVLHCLGNESRMVYILRKIIHLSYSEIAYIMEKDESAVRKDFSRSRKKISEFLNHNCILYNPQGNCQCRSKTLVRKIDLKKEYDKIHKINFFKQSEQVLPRKNYWEKFLET